MIYGIKMRLYNRFLYALMASMLFLASSCCKNEYVNAIPADCMAVGFADFSNNDAGKGLDVKNIMKSVLGMDVSEQLGIDFEEKVYFFETNDGLFGLCAKIDDDDKLLDALNMLMVAENSNNKVHEYKDFHFAVIKNSWMAGFSDNTLLLVGPVTNSQYKSLEQRMAKWMEADEDKSIVSKPIYQHLEDIKAPMALVTQVKAIPEQFRLPFTMGMPKDADASQVMVALTMKIDGDIVDMQGETFSFNQQVDKALKEAANSFRPVTEKFVKSMENDALAALFLNAEGERLLELLRSNQGSQILLTGVNTSIDMDNILRCVDGDFMFMLSSLHGQRPEMALGAQLKSTQFLKDVGYWKSSCPQGTKIEDVGTNAFRLFDGETDYYFGIGENNLFYAGNLEDVANFGQQQAKQPIPDMLKKKIMGQKMCLCINIQQLYENQDFGKVLTSFLKPVFGNAKTLVYHQK